MERERTQGSFGEAQIPARRGRNAQLEAIDAAIDWGRFAQRGLGEALLTGGEAAVHADRAYDTAERRDLWGAMRIDCRILRRADKYHLLSEAQRELNALWERVRRKVEPVFGTFKRSYGYRATRYFNLERNRFEFYLKCIAFNLCKLVRL